MYQKCLSKLLIVLGLSLLGIIACLNSLPTYVFAKSPALATTYYVDVTANGTNDGLSWTNAFTDVADALSVAVFWR